MIKGIPKYNYHPSTPTKLYLALVIIITKQFLQ